MKVIQYLVTSASGQITFENEGTYWVTTLNISRTNKQRRVIVLTRS